MKKFFLTIGLILSSLLFVYAQKIQTPEEQANYTNVITKRADKIVDVLGIKDSVKYGRVRDVLVNQYRKLSNIHDTRDAEVAAINNAKKQPGADKAAENAEIAVIDTNVAQQLHQLHETYISRLSKELSPEQIDKVKDEMTYKVLEVTYNGYLDELPNLTDEQKKKIKNWLIEAREHAIDAGSSKEKHEWFGKYKGRINNYLSAQGYDMKKAGEEWQKRIKERAEQKQQK
ncbi:DUF3826 domain-containing protein [Mucilaginibacter sp.]|uniref:DUF3826 domain-containing protein n=1 Tax=Mucilaginibacter sp. TaxID=1882438 RepID=UPI002614F895|nr:DUF3826 domain-containing protein [Mucilaginibacter sp.]MDB4919554.1 hypothetical protein [Mucilaginibacter sp.]